MYVFYDFETTGLNPAFEQVLQFAAIYTDDAFNEIEVVNERCQLRKDVIPSPIAMAITGMTPQIITDPSLPTEYEFSKRMSSLISKWSPSIFAGYNTIAFDEEFLRHSFYHNLHPNIYKTQFDGNSRFDVLNVVAAVSAISPDAIKLPINAKGKQSLKLEDVACANGFEGHHAHDALGDVRATIFVASLIRSKAPDVWDMMASNGDKSHVTRNLHSGKPHFLIENNFGRRTIYPICYAGAHPQNSSEYAIIDLSKEGVVELLNGSDDAIDKALSASPRLIRRIKTNAHPIIFECDQFEGFRVADDQFRLADLITNNAEFQQRVSAALKRRSDAYEPYPYYEQRIYDGFPSHKDKVTLQQLYAANDPEKSALIHSIECPRLRYLGQKLLWLYSPENMLSPEASQQIDGDIRARWNSNLPVDDKQLLWACIQKIKSEMLCVEQN